MSAFPQKAPKRATSTKTMSIGVVLKKLSAEFPDITVSKIRFLESEGLISPQRTSSGYRRFTESDVERLRYILVTQRDNYTPLKVIREQLEAMDSGQVTAIVSAASADPLISPESFRAPVAIRLTDTDVAEQAQVSVEFVTDLVAYGLITPDPAGFFNADDVRVVQTSVALTEFGFDARQLKMLKTAALRQAGLIQQVTSPVAHSKKDTAQQQAEELSQQMSAMVVSLHATLLKNALREDRN